MRLTMRLEGQKWRTVRFEEVQINVYITLDGFVFGNFA